MFFIPPRRGDKAVIPVYTLFSAEICVDSKIETTYSHRDRQTQRQTDRQRKGRRKRVKKIKAPSVTALPMSVFGHNCC